MDIMCEIEKGKENGISKRKEMGKELDSGELETVKGLKYNLDFLKWLIPVALTAFLGLAGFLAWMAKSALMGEIRAAIQAEVKPVRTEIRTLERKMERMEERQRSQHETISEIKSKLK